MISDNNKRVAKNTILLYARLLFAQIIGLYTSRKVLEILGVEDFGIYNVVGGIVVFMTFLNGSMSVATSRYLTVELGKGDEAGYRKVFGMAFHIHAILSLLVLLGAETVGLWFLNTQMNIPEARMHAANVIYQISVISTVLGIIQTPYGASITAHEHMNIYAYIGIEEVIAKLLIVLGIDFLAKNVDNLEVYAFLMLCVQVINFCIYLFYCRKKFAYCRVSRLWDKTLFRSMFGFTGWNLFGTIAWILKDQGVNVVLNIFGGPLVNGARGVAGQASGAVSNIVGCFNTAVSPQITKNYASGDKRGLHRLMMLSSKISYILLLMLTVPVLYELNFLLNIWLVKVPEHTLVFTKIIMIEGLIGVLGNAFISPLIATGDIKKYQVIVGSIMLLNVPMSWILLKYGLPIYVPFVISIGLTTLAGIIRLYLCHQMLSFSVVKYVKNVLIPICILTFLSFTSVGVIVHIMEEGWLRLLVVCFMSIIIIAFTAYFICFDKNEQTKILELLTSKIRNKLRWQNESA